MDMVKQGMASAVHMALAMAGVGMTEGMTTGATLQGMHTAAELQHQHEKGRTPGPALSGSMDALQPEQQALMIDQAVHCRPDSKQHSNSTCSSMAPHDARQCFMILHHQSREALFHSRSADIQTRTACNWHKQRFSKEKSMSA